MPQNDISRTYHVQTFRTQNEDITDANSVEFRNGTPTNLAENAKRIWVDQQTEELNYTVDGIHIRTVQRELGFINVKDFGAKGDGVTDDSLSIKAAIAFMCSLAKPTSGASAGWKTFMPTLFFPAGRYVISQKGTLNCVGTALQGYNMSGEGYHSTEILYTYTPGIGEVDDHLLINGDNNWFGRSYISDLLIRGNGTNRFWKVKSKAGAPQACRFRRVAMHDLVDCVTVEFGTANANADIFHFEFCTAKNISGWVFGIPNVQTSQSLIHSFTDCDFELISGKCLYFVSGGAVEVRGGNWIISKTGRIIHCEDTSGAGIGTSNNFFNFTGTRFEWQHRDNTDPITTYYPLFFNSSNAKIKFEDCNFGQFISAGHQFPKYDHGIITRLGRLIFQDCYVPAIMTFRVEIKGLESLGERTASIEFRECKMDAQLFDTVGTTFIDNPGATGRNPTVFASRCRSILKDEPVDVTLYKNFGSRFVNANRSLYSYTQNDTTQIGLPAKVAAPDPDKVTTFKLPRGSILRKVRIIFTNLASSQTFTITLKNFDNSITFHTASIVPNTIPAGSYSASLSAEIYYQVNLETERTINVIGSGGNIATGGIPGYIEVEYD